MDAPQSDHATIAEDIDLGHVEPDFFDPPGVQELQRQITQHSDSGTLIPGNNEPFDFEKMLTNLHKKLDEEGEIKKRQLGVVFSNLEVVGLGSETSFQPTIGSVFNPLQIFSNIRTARHPVLKNILSDFEGVVKPGEMLLVLGRPGSGCSTLLKTLANQTEEYHSVNGERQYDTLSPTDISQRYRGDIQYCPEDDVHFPSLTVGQTISFAAKTRAPQTRLSGDSRSSYVSHVTKVLTTIFGLGHTMDTPVGDAAIRGVSGGEKKRVSISEAMATRSRIACWDNSTRGLDASTALEFGRALRIATDIDKVTTILSIYQSGQTLYNLFDKVCVIYEGKMAYFGPANRARQYFIDMGYEPANRQTTPDFLVAVTDPNGRIPRQISPPPPRSSDEFAAYFSRSKLGLSNTEEVKAYRRHVKTNTSDWTEKYKESAKAEHSRNTRKSSPYTISLAMQTRAVMLRRVQILKGNPTAQIITLASFVIQGIITGSVYVNSPNTTSSYFSRGGIIFFAILFSTLTSMTEIPALFSQRPIVQRHQKAALYHPFIEAVAMTLVDLPVTLMVSAVFGIILYFIVGLQRSAGQFFIFYLFLATITIAMKAWFRAIAAAFKSEASAQAVAGILLLVLVIYTGFTIPKPSMVAGLRWITYINPMRYAFEGLISNEFSTLNGSCTGLIPNGPDYANITLANQVCAFVGAIPGQTTVDGNRFIKLSYDYSRSKLWFNYGILLVFLVGFASILLFFTEMNTASSTDVMTILFKKTKATSKTKNVQPSVDEEKLDSPSLNGTFGQDSEVQIENDQALKAATPMTDVFSWQHIEYTVPVPSGERKLLDDVSGYVAPGKLTALMGESGAGKTTLLNVLAERYNSGVVTGEKFVNGQKLPSDFQAQTGYVQQMDTHVPTDTVREAIVFSAVLRQPESVSLEEKMAYAEQCIKMAGLESVADAIIGSLGIEHRKRTTIGVELAAKPKLLLFLDEPTSGLDSQSAWAIMSFLRKLADNGQAILCTIHQPSAELFQVFDRLLLLKKGGQTVYFGDIGPSSTTLIGHFERNGARVCHEDENPAEYILEAIGAGATATTTQDWYQAWLKSPESKALQVELETLHAEGRSRPAVEATLHTEFATSWMNQTRELIKRDMRGHWRSPTYLMAKLSLNVVAGLFIGFTFYKSKNTQQGTQNKLFAIFMSTIVSAPLTNQLQVPFIHMRNIYEIRERSSRMYSWTALITSQLAAELPWNMFGSSMYFVCWYWTVGFLNDRAGYTYLMLGVCFPIYYTCFAFAVAAMAPDAEISALIFSLLFSFVITFNGVLQPFRALGWWQWMYRLSPFTYLIEGLLGQAIGKQTMECSATEYVSLTPPSGQTCGQYLEKYLALAGGYITNPSANDSCQICSFKTTDEFLFSRFNIEYVHRWRNVGFMFAYIVFNFVLVFAATYFFRIRKGSLIGSIKKRLFSKR